MSTMVSYWFFGFQSITRVGQYIFSPGLSCFQCKYSFTSHVYFVCYCQCEVNFTSLFFYVCKCDRVLLVIGGDFSILIQTCMFGLKLHELTQSKASMMKIPKFQIKRSFYDNNKNPTVQGRGTVSEDWF